MRGAPSVPLRTKASSSSAVSAQKRHSQANIRFSMSAAVLEEERDVYKSTATGRSAEDDKLWMYGETSESLGLIEVPFWQHGTTKITGGSTAAGLTGTTSNSTKRYTVVPSATANNSSTGTTTNSATTRYSLQLIPSTATAEEEKEDVYNPPSSTSDDAEDPQRIIHWKGCTSFVCCPRAKKTVSSRCSPLNPNVISLFWTDDDSTSTANSLYSIEIDLKAIRSNQMFGPTIVKTTPFLLPNHLLSLHLVDESVTILILSIDLKSSHQSQPVQYIPSLLKHIDINNNNNNNNNTPQYYLSSDSRLSSNHQCDWINPDVLIFAVPPYLQAFSIQANTIQTWISSTSIYIPPAQKHPPTNRFIKTMFQFLLPPTSPSQEENDDINYNSEDDATLERLWHKLTKQQRQKYLLNQQEEYEGHDDDDDDEEEHNFSLPVSTAALTVLRPTAAQEEEDDDDEEHSLVCVPLVLTLHSDGSMRKWTMMPKLVKYPTGESDDTNRDWLLPTAVHKLRVLLHSAAAAATTTCSTVEPYLSPPLPPSREWSPTHDAIQLTSTFCSGNKRFALALSIRTFHPEKQQQPHNLYVMVGPTFFNTYGALMEEDKKFTTIVSCYKLHPIPTTAATATTTTTLTTITSRTSIVSLSLKDTTSSTSATNVNQPADTTPKQPVDLYCLYSYYTNSDDSILRTGLATYRNWFAKPSFTKFTSDAILDNLCYNDVIDCKESHEDNKIERFFMKLIFKSVYPRPFGDIHPLDFIVRKSLRKTCSSAPSKMMYQKQYSSGGSSSRVSIEAETLMAMRQWKVQQQCHEDDYSNHWQKLIRTIRQEEAHFQRPLFLSTSTATMPIQALVIRTGYTSLFVESSSSNINPDYNDASKTISLLDMLCLSLLQSDSMVQSSVERLLQDVISSASLLSKCTSQQLLLQIDKTLQRSSHFMAMIMAVAKDFIQLIDHIEETQLLSWTNSCHTSLAIPLLQGDIKSDFSNIAMKQPQPQLIIDTAIYMSRIHVESSRKLSLARCLVLCSMPTYMLENPNIQNIWSDAVSNSLRVLLEMTALQWASSEPYSSSGSSNSSISNTNRNKGTNLLFHSVKKDNTDKHYSSSSLLEAELSRMSSTLVMDGLSSDSAIGRSLSAAYQLSTYFYRRVITSTSGIVFGFSSSDGVMEASSFFSKKLLPPRLLLRVLAPSVSSSLSSTRSNAITANHLVSNLFLRKTVVAECMLKEASFAQKYKLLSDEGCKRLREAALDLFESAENDTALSFVVNTYFDDLHDHHGSEDDKMMVVREEDTVRDDSVHNQEILAVAIQRLLGIELLQRAPQLSASLKESITRRYMESHSVPCVSIIRLIQLPSFSTLILNLVRDFTGQPFSHMSLLSPDELVMVLQRLMEKSPSSGDSSTFWVLLRRLQKVSHTISLLELAERNTADHALILKCALNGVHRILALPAEVVHSMPEFANLWSSVFRHAAKIQDWNQSFDACRRNPVESRRSADFKRLVAFMVESGALAELLLLPKRVDDDVAFDLYEAIASALMSKAKEENSSLSNEYYSSSYSLFTFIEDWRRSASVLDDWYQSTINNATSDNLVGEKKEEDLRCRVRSLTAVACSNSIELVDDASVKFLVSDPTVLEGDFVSRLKSDKDVDQRALVALSCHLLQSDASVVSALSTQAPPLKDVFTALCSAGYYFQAIALALKSNDCSNNEVFSKDFLLTRIACDYLVQDSVKLLNTSIRESTIAENSVTHVKPTRSQMCAASQSPYGANVGFNADKAASMELLRTIVRKYARADNCLAVEVARALLDRGYPAAALPLWLFNMLTGEQEAGVFASSKTSCSPKNPTALMKLYIERGLLLPAVEVVVSLLIGKSDGGLQKRQTSTRRVPEKGSIDFIPYAYIDLLYRLLQKAGASSAHEDTELLIGCRKLEEALKFHFDHLCVAEEAIQSARLLMF